MRRRLRLLETRDPRAVLGVAVWVVAAGSLVVTGCSHEPGRAVLVEADTTQSAGRPTEVSAPRRDITPAGSLEVVVLESGEASATVAQERPGATADPVDRLNSTDPRSVSLAEGEGLHDAGRQAGSDEPDRVEGRDPGAVGEGPEHPVLPEGTILEVELRTPLHTATTVVGDRFAARLTRAVTLGGRIVVPAGALIEGRVVHVGNANEPSRTAYLALDARSIRTTSGLRLPITAHLISAAGHEVVEPQVGKERAGAAGGAAAGAVLGGVIGQDSRAAVLGSLIGGIAGRAIVARTADREIVVPTGTSLTLELIEPLEIPPATIVP